MDEANEMTPKTAKDPPSAPSGYHQRRRNGEPRTAEDRRYDRDRQRRARALRRERIEALEAELDEENAVREDKRAEAKTATDPELRTELWISRIMAEATRNRGNGPGQKIPQDDPQEIQARNEEFDRQREEALRGSILISRRTLYALTHSIPGGWSNDDKYDDHFPPELRFARLRDEQTIS